jgi:aspartyl-tRNA(Asn)/glutamyl-tRNA(Gln) amidotransferase subunit A
MSDRVTGELLSMSQDQVSARLTERGLSVTDDEVKAVTTDLGRISAMMERLEPTLKASDDTNAFGRMLETFSRPQVSSSSAWMEWEANRDGPIPATDHALEKAVDTAHQLNCFIEIFPRKAEQLARRLHEENHGTQYPLYGIPFAYKDVLSTADRQPTAGVGQGYQWESQSHSVALKRLVDAGAIPIGALNLDPHCYTATGFNSYHGRVLNPHGPAYAIGGSSSGAAAAVAAGIVPFALGTDTGGSVRIPASLCGVYGLKPTHGLIQDPGVVPLSASHDTIGILAENPALIGRVLGVLSGPRDVGEEVEDKGQSHLRHSFGVTLEGVKIGTNTTELLAGMDEAVTGVFRRTRDALVSLGAELVEIPFPSIDDLNACASIITSYEADAVHGDALARHPEYYPPSVRRRLLTAACVSREDYQSVLRLRGKYLAEVLAQALSDADFLVCPTIRISAPRVDHIPDDAEAGGALSLEFLRMNRPFSFLGLPSLSIPVGVDANNIPIGLQVIGRPFSDYDLLALAETMRQRLD